VHRGSQPVGAFVCKCGQTTDYTCGYIRSKRYRPSNWVPNANNTFIRVGRSGVDLSAGGDSGGPWFKTSKTYGTGAYRVHSGGRGNEAIYMAINYASAMNVRVIRTK
jgi:hypothetical protein